MNILTDLRAALEIWEAAEAAYYDYDRSDIVEIARRLDDKMRARSVLFSKLIRYAPALLDSAEAAETLVERMHMIHADERYKQVWVLALQHGDIYADGPTYRDEVDALEAALAPLVKEDTDES